MATRATNEAKREQMAAILNDLLTVKGYSQKEIAGIMRVTSSAVSQWKLGKSMGTNAQRAFLAKLPVKAEGLPVLDKTIENVESSIASFKQDIEATKAKTEEYIKHVTESVAFDIEWHAQALTKAEFKAAEAAVPGAPKHVADYITEKRSHGNLGEVTSYEWDKHYHAEQLNEAKSRNNDTYIRAKASSDQSGRVGYYERQVAKLNKELATLKTLRNNW